MQNLSGRKLIDRKGLKSLIQEGRSFFPELEIGIRVDQETILPIPRQDDAEHHLLEFDGRKVHIDVSGIPQAQTAQLFLRSLEYSISGSVQKAMLGQEVLEKYREINSMFQLSSALHQAKFLEDVGQVICSQLADALQCETVILGIRREIRKKEVFARLAKYGTDICEDETRELEALRDLVAQNSIADIYTQPEARGFPQGTPAPLLFAPLRAKEEDLGGLILANPKKGWFDSGDLKMAVTLASASAYSLENALLFEEIEQVFDSMMRGMIAAIDERDSATSGHSARISMICERFARAVNRTKSGKYADYEFTREQLREIRYAGLLHDIGKIGVREEVLKKKNRLHEGVITGILARLDYAELLLNQDLSRARTSIIRSNQAYNLLPEDKAILEELHQTQITNHRDEVIHLLNDSEFEALSLAHGNLTFSEVQEMRKHPAGSLKILSKIQFSRDLRNIPIIAAQHHEKLDGTGYPLGITGDKILLQSQIMCIADIYEALVAKDRPYKPPLSREDSLAIIEQEVREGKIEPELFLIFKENLDAIVGAGK